jgi:hypothetical protein
MKFWKSNRLDAEFDMPAAEVARLVAESRGGSPVAARLPYRPAGPAAPRGTTRTPTARSAASSRTARPPVPADGSSDRDTAKPRAEAAR